MNPTTRWSLAALALLATGNISSVRSPSPAILFASKRSGDWELYRMDADGTRQAPLGRRAGQDRFPLPSPDGSRIAFGSERDNGWELWVMDRSGDHAVRVARGIAAKALRGWSPDGLRIVFEARPTGAGTGAGDIFTVRADGTGLTRLTSSGDSHDPQWSPDGTTIGFSSTRGGTREIYSIPAAGGDATQLTSGARVFGGPVWSPDGRRMAFASERDGNRELYVMNRDGTHQTRITSDPAADFAPHWSPDGTTLLFQAVRGRNYDVEVVRIADGRRLRLTSDTVYDGMGSWSPEGTSIVLLSGRAGYDAVYRMRGDGTDVRRLTAEASLDPAWWP